MNVGVPGHKDSMQKVVGLRCQRSSRNKGLTEAV